MESLLHRGFANAQARIRNADSHGLDEDRSKLYVDLIFNALSEAARRAFQAMNSVKYDYQSGLGSGFFEHGREEGARTLVIKLLTRRFGDLTEAARAQLADASVEELDAIGERLLSAPTLEKALGSN